MIRDTLRPFLAALFAGGLLSISAGEALATTIQIDVSGDTFIPHNQGQDAADPGHPWITAPDGTTHHVASISGSIQFDTADYAGVGLLTPHTGGLTVTTTDGGSFVLDKFAISNAFGVNQLYFANWGPTGAIELNVLLNQDVRVGLPDGAIVPVFDPNHFSTMPFALFDHASDGFAGMNVYLDTLSYRAVPEPASLALAGLGAASVVLRRRRRRA